MITLQKAPKDLFSFKGKISSKKAKEQKSYYGDVVIVVPVICHLANFVAAGIHGDLVFSKVHLEQTAYDKAISKRP